MASVASGYVSYDWSQSTGVTFVSVTTLSAATFTVNQTATSITLKCSIRNNNTSADPSGDPATGQSSPTVVALNPTITVANTFVTKGKTGLIASTKTDYTTYDWSPSVVTITAGAGTSQITYSIGASATAASLACTITNGLGDSASGSLNLTPVDPAAVVSIEPPTFALSGRALPAASLTYAPLSQPWTYNWGGATGIVGSGVQPLFGISFSSSSGTLAVSAVNQAGVVNLQGLPASRRICPARRARGMRAGRRRRLAERIC